MKLLVLGSNGQVGRSFRYLTKANKNIFFLQKSKINYHNFYVLSQYIKNKKIDLIINCAAFTDVNLANIQISVANNYNYYFVKKINKICKNYNISLIHLSTDYVFDGKKKVPYKENSKTKPLNEYGKSKLKADKFLMQQNYRVIIIRTSWVFSYTKNNIVKKIINIAKNNDKIKVVNNQFGSPTYSYDLAKAILKLIQHKKFSLIKKPIIFNFSNKGVASWFSFAKLILKMKKINCRIVPISLDSYPNIAIRPVYSVLNVNKITKHFNFRIRSWRKALVECIQNQR